MVAFLERKKEILEREREKNERKWRREKGSGRPFREGEGERWLPKEAKAFGLGEKKERGRSF